MKNIIISIIALCFVIRSDAQTINNNVIAAGGKTKITGNIMLEYTVGEPFVKTLTSANNKITQGFHQPNIVVARMADATDTSATISDEMLSARLEQPVVAGSFKVEVYPNPATDYVKVKMSEQSFSKTFMFLSDATGKLIEAKQLTEPETTIEFNQYSNGKYFLVIKTEDGTINESFRIVKVN